MKYCRVVPAAAAAAAVRGADADPVPAEHPRRVREQQRRPAAAAARIRREQGRFSGAAATAGRGIAAAAAAGGGELRVERGRQKGRAGPAQDQRLPVGPPSRSGPEGRGAGALRRQVEPGREVRDAAGGPEVGRPPRGAAAGLQPASAAEECVREPARVRRRAGRLGVPWAGGAAFSVGCGAGRGRLQ